MHALKLEGVDGQHLWGFLVALGALALLDEHARAEALDVPRLAFQEDGTAVLHSPVPEQNVVLVLLARLRELQPFLEEDLAAVNKPSDFTRLSYESIAIAGAPARLGFLAGLGCVIGTEASESTLCAANGASHQNLIQSMRDVLNLVEGEHLRLALFATWKNGYHIPDDKRRQLGLGSRKPTLRLDPSDERLYALRLSDPTTTDDFRTELGAQALAIPAFAQLPVVPSKKPATVGSARHRQRVTFSWALWSLPATLPTVRTLLWGGVRCSSVQRIRGAFAAFAADRVSGAKGKLSFAPSHGVW